MILNECLPLACLRPFQPTLSYLVIKTQAHRREIKDEGRITFPLNKFFTFYICRGETIFIKVFLVFIVALVFVAASTRYIGYPINWSIDVAVCLFAWCTFLSADVAMRNNKLMKVDFLVRKLSKKNQDFIEFINFVIIAIFLVALIGFALWISYTTRFRTFQGIPGFSYTWVTLSVPVGSASMLITAIIKIRERLAK